MICCAPPHPMVLVLWGGGSILGNGYEFQIQQYAALLQGIEMLSGFEIKYVMF